VCVYVCVCVSVCVCLRVGGYECLYACVCVFVRMRAGLGKCAKECACVRGCASVYTCGCTLLREKEGETESLFSCSVSQIACIHANDFIRTPSFSHSCLLPTHTCTHAMHTLDSRIPACTCIILSFSLPSFLFLSPLLSLMCVFVYFGVCWDACVCVCI